MSRLRCRSFRMITWSSKSRRQLPTQRSATPFCHGLRNAVRVGWLPRSLTAESTSAPNFASRSSSKNRCCCWQAHASRNCCTTQSALGFRVTLRCRIFRRSWPMTKKQYRTPNVSVGTVKKSIAAMPSRWFLRNVCLANCYFAHDSSGFPTLLLFFDAQSGRSCYPLDCHAGPVARTWWRPFPGRGVASPETPAPDRESLSSTIAQSICGGPRPCRLDGALGPSYSSSPHRNCSEAFDTASRSQSHEQAKVPHAVLTEPPSEARSERTQRRTHPFGGRNEAA